MSIADFLKSKKFIITLFIVGASLAALLIIKFSPPVKNYLEAFRQRQQLQAVYKNDKFGGVTPEETYGLFIDALQKNDVALASRYFIPEKQNQWSKTLSIYQKSNGLGDFLTELIHNREIWQKTENGKEVVIYRIENSSEVIFEKNPVNKIWKLRDL